MSASTTLDKRYENGPEPAGKSRAARALEPQQLYTPCDPAQLEFATTEELEPLEAILGQPRAMEALRFGIGIRREGYNLYALGAPGTGKRAIVKLFLDERAAREPPSPDLCYVNDFETPHRPLLLELPAGLGSRLRRDIDRLLDEVRGAITAAFESEEYRARRHKLEEALKKEHEQLFDGLAREAQAQDIAMVRTPTGIAFAPVRAGEVVNPEAFRALPEKEQKRIEEAIAALEERLQQRLEELPKWQRERQERIHELDRDVTGAAVRHIADEVRKKYAAFPLVLNHLDKLERAIIDNADDFRRAEGAADTPFGLPLAKDASTLRRYRVNVAVDRTGATGAPVVHEDNPTYHNLVGRIEHVAQWGALVTDFMLIKAGALHRANGGYLLLDARKLLMQPFAWEALKRALASRELRMEEPGQMLGLISTVSLEPEPVSLDVKIVLLGDRIIYYLLYQLDPDFAELFKVAADFEDDMERDPETQRAYARLIGALVRKEKLLPFERSAVARTLDHAARLAADAGKLSLRLRAITDLLREADYWARDAGQPVVSAGDVQRAIDARVYRHDRARARLQEEIERGVFLIDTRGKRAGQANGLSVEQFGGFTFGHPTRITARARLGKGDVLDIQREVKLSGPIHSKGVLILTGFLAGRYLLERPLSMSASLVFEQTYAEVEGDSASCAELYALLSAIADMPLDQSLAVTGAVNQHGDVQAIGSVNEKIEGFFEVCRRQGLTGEQGVLIPAANVRHLMLRADVVEAARRGKFHIYPVRTIDDGLELLTGKPAGARDANGLFPEGSVNRLVESRLLAMAEEAHRFLAPGIDGAP